LSSFVWASPDSDNSLARFGPQKRASSEKFECDDPEPPVVPINISKVTSKPGGSRCLHLASNSNVGIFGQALVSNVRDDSITTTPTRQKGTST
jgi:hypothetical protein